jgi:hypothetical protein
MKTCPGLLAAFSVFALCAASLIAQQGTVGSAGFGPPTVIAEPYSATMETEISQTLADGTHIQRKTTTQKLYRDSQGRTGSEQYLSDPAVANVDADAPASIVIHDPVSGVVFMLNPRERTARQLAPAQHLHASLPGPKVSVSRPPPVPESLRLRDEMEPLGTQMMEGLLVTGSRTTTTIPTGAQGNDRPMVIVNEQWVSKDLRLTLLARTSDPRTGDRSMRVTGLDRNDPDPSLFEVPAEYTIVPPQ